MSKLIKTQFSKWTSARVAIGRAGASLPTSQVLAFQRAHAEARNAVLKVWNFECLQKQLLEQGENVFLVSSQTTDRNNFLKFPNKGRSLSAASRNLLTSQNLQPIDVCFIVSDGLSSLAIEHNFLPLWQNLKVELQKPFFSQTSTPANNSTNDLHNYPPEHLPEQQLSYRLVLAPFARVALSDEIGQILKAKLSIIFIGERPGLNSANSLGVYLTYHPKPGNTDAQRNCISNVRPPEGLSYEMATAKLIYLIKQSLRLQLSGVDLKDESNFLESSPNQLD